MSASEATASVSTIVKVQVPSHGPDAPALVCPENGKRAVHTALPESVTRQMRGAAKAYFRAIWTGSRYTLRERVAYQDW